MPTMLEQNDLWTHFVKAAWDEKKRVDTGRQDDRIWINSDLFFTEPTVVFRVGQRKGPRAVSLAVTNAAADRGLGFVMTPTLVNGAAPAGSVAIKGIPRFIPASLNERAHRYLLRTNDHAVDEAEMPAYFLRESEELLKMSLTMPTDADVRVFPGNPWTVQYGSDVNTYPDEQSALAKACALAAHHRVRCFINDTTREAGWKQIDAMTRQELVNEVR
jgi:hypothetical protein